MNHKSLLLFIFSILIIIYGCVEDEESGEAINQSPKPSPPPVTQVFINSISAGKYHTCAQLSNGFAKCWGRNDDGQLGDESGTDRYYATTVHSLTDSVKISAGRSHTCAVISDKTVRCWGENSDGQLGDGTTIDSRLPLSIPSFSGVVDIKSGYNHTCSQLSDNSIWCWGSNSFDVFGMPTVESDRPSPTFVSTLNNISNFSLYYYHSVQFPKIKCHVGDIIDMAN